MGTIIAPQSDFQSNYLNCSSNIIVAGGAMGCVPAETEFLTESGWKKISDYEVGDKVGTVSLDDKSYNNAKLSFSKPLRFIKEPCESMNFIESDGFRKTLSDEHKVPYWINKKLYVKSWKDIFFEILKGDNFGGVFKRTIDVISEHPYQLEKDKVEEISKIVSLSGVKEFLFNSELESDIVQYILASTGIISDIDKIESGYRLTVTETEEPRFSENPVTGYHKTTDGYKYCFEVDTGFFLVRESGRIFVTGNSSKSYIGLMRHLRWAEDPYYRGYCIRKNSTTLMKPSGLFEEALDIYRQYDPRVVPKLKNQTIDFPSGAKVAFSHYENNNAQELYRGLQLSSCFYDESTDAQENHIWFLISRLRTKANMQPSIWLTCNPDPDHFLREWVDWWLYPEGHEKFGLPDPDKNGKERYILRIGDDIFWGDSREELIIKHGRNDLPLDHARQVKPLSITVLLGNIYDNPILVHTNPHYVAALESLPEIEKRRNLYGDWEAREEGSSYFDRKWVTEMTDIDEEQVVSTVRSFDLAGTLKSDKNPSPDYTASVRMRKLKNGMYVVDDVVRHRIRAGDWKDFIIGLSEKDPSNTTYLYPVDPNPAAKRMADLMVRELIEEAGLTIKKIDTNKSKLDRFRPFSSMAQNGGVSFLSDCGTDLENEHYNCLKFVYRELEVFTGERKRSEVGHDDIVDCMSDAFYELASGSKRLGNISGALNSFR